MNDPEFKLDKAGFPMVRVDALDAYIHWLPVTKIQFEYFMCEEPDSQFDDLWYDEICQINPRTSPKSVRSNNYWQGFLTGIYPREAQRFAHWCGEGFAIPTLAEWNTIYREFKGRAAYPAPLDKLPNLKERVQTLLTQMDAAGATVSREIGYPRTLADQMLMRLGVMEWVDCADQRHAWGGMGETYPRFHGMLFTPDHGQPSRLHDPEKQRLYYYGFRLIQRTI